jgi:hypothetical protein
MTDTNIYTSWSVPVDTGSVPVDTGKWDQLQILPSKQ